MKTAVTIAGENAKESAFVVWRGFEDSIRKASEYGYDGVELALKGADDIDRAALRRWLKAYKIEVSCITTGQVFADRGLYFTHSDPVVRKKAVDVFTELIELAEEFGGLVNAGRTRGFVGAGQSRTEAEKLFVDTMRILCDKASCRNVQVLIEPVNRYEINFINNLDQGTEILKRVQRDNCGLHADVFHMNIEDDYIGESLVRNGDWVRYVHFADSNRLAPGMGHLDFNEVMGALNRIDYNGWVSVEILPGHDPDDMAKRAINFIKPKVDAYNKQKYDQKGYGYGC